MSTAQYDPTKVASAEVAPTADIAGLIVAAGGQPSWATYDAGTQVLHVRGLDQATLDAALVEVDPRYSERQSKKMLAQAELALRIAAGMPWRGQVADIDEVSTNRMTSVIVAAQVGLLGHGIEWRMQDNTMLALDAAGMLAMATAAFGYVAALRAHYWLVIDQAKNAADQDALDLIDTGQGWPAPPASPPA